MARLVEVGCLIANLPNHCPCLAEKGHGLVMTPARSSNQSLLAPMSLMNETCLTTMLSYLERAIWWRSVVCGCWYKLREEFHSSAQVQQIRRQTQWAHWRKDMCWGNNESHLGPGSVGLESEPLVRNMEWAIDLYCSSADMMTWLFWDGCGARLVLLQGWILWRHSAMVSLVCQLVLRCWWMTVRSGWW